MKGRDPFWVVRETPDTFTKDPQTLGSGARVETKREFHCIWMVGHDLLSYYPLRKRKKQRETTKELERPSEEKEDKGERENV